MKKEQEYLLKHFASILRALALGKQIKSAVDTNVAHCLTRRNLIQILKKQFGGTIPKEHNLVEMEKLELLKLVKNEMLVISYMTEKWSLEGLSTVVKNEVVASVKKESPKPSANNKNKNDTISK